MGYAPYGWYSMNPGYGSSGGFSPFHSPFHTYGSQGGFFVQPVPFPAYNGPAAGGGGGKKSS